jgi:hypothetical protein
LATDPFRQSEPVKFQDIQANLLISPCRAAITSATKSQDQARYYLQLGRTDCTMMTQRARYHLFIDRRHSPIRQGTLLFV